MAGASAEETSTTQTEKELLDELAEELANEEAEEAEEGGFDHSLLATIAQHQQGGKTATESSEPQFKKKRKGKKSRKAKHKQVGNIKVKLLDDDTEAIELGKMPVGNTRI